MRSVFIAPQPLPSRRQNCSHARQYRGLNSPSFSCFLICRYHADFSSYTRRECTLTSPFAQYAARERFQSGGIRQSGM